MLLIGRLKAHLKHQRGSVRLLEITSPNEGSIAIAGIPVIFQARTIPAKDASQIRWSVTTQPDLFGEGPSFSFTPSVTGAEQVVAHLESTALRCDVVVYVFKTPGNGTTIGDLLRSEPPLQQPRAFTRYGRRVMTPGDA
jgi:hypothetical protein